MSLLPYSPRILPSRMDRRQRITPTRANRTYPRDQVSTMPDTAQDTPATRSTGDFDGWGAEDSSEFDTTDGVMWCCWLYLLWFPELWGEYIGIGVWHRCRKRSACSTDFQFDPYFTYRQVATSRRRSWLARVWTAIPILSSRTLTGQYPVLSRLTIDRPCFGSMADELWRYWVLNVDSNRKLFALCFYSCTNKPSTSSTQRIALSIGLLPQASLSPHFHTCEPPTQSFTNTPSAT
jgi:hypothetical protein